MFEQAASPDHHRRISSHEGYVAHSASVRKVQPPTRKRDSSQFYFQRLFAPAHGVIVLAGYGIKLQVEKGHLTVEDGIGDHRRRARFPRVHHGLRRVVVIGSEGFIALPAIRWMADQKVSFTMLERTGDLLLSTGPVYPSDARMRREQAMSKNSPLALQIARELIGQKLTEQAELLRRQLAKESSASAVSKLNESLRNLKTLDEIILCEGQGAAIYWAAWKDVSAPFSNETQLWFRSIG